MPSVSRQLARTGHFEFGTHKRAENHGDSSRAAHIQACFGAGRIVEGYAHQWASTYGWLIERLTREEALRGACLLVRYDRLCLQPEATLRTVFRHAGVPMHETELLIRTNAACVSAPDYYPTQLSEEEAALARAITGGVWQKFSIES